MTNDRKHFKTIFDQLNFIAFQTELSMVNSALSSSLGWKKISGWCIPQRKMEPTVRCVSYLVINQVRIMHVD